MRYKFYREHKYVSAALNDLERLVARTDFRDPTQTQLVTQQFNDLALMLEGHAQYENERLHALLAEKGSILFAHIEEDHQKQEEDLTHLRALLVELAGSDQLIERGYQFYLTYRKFVADNLAHLYEEETIILPELQRLYSDAELRAVEERTYRLMTAEQMVEMMQLLFPHMNISDKEAFLKDIQICQPEKFPSVWTGIKPSLSPTEIEQFSNHLISVN